MQQVNLFKTKLYALAIAGIGLIGMFLSWATVNIPAAVQQQMNGLQNGLGNQMGGIGQVGATVQQTQNGFASWGFLSLAGVAGVLLVTFFMGDKTRDYDKQTKNLAMLSFLAIAGGALIFMLVSNSEGKKYAAVFQQRGITYSFGAGLWITMIAGGIGILWLGGIIDKFFTQQPVAANTAPPTTPTA